MSEPLSVGRLFQIVVRFWVMIVVVTVVAGAAAFAATQAMTTTYTATATQLVKALPGVGVTANYEAAQFAVARAKSYPYLVYSAPVLDGVRSDLGNAESVEDLRHDLSATNPADTPLVQLTATGRTREEAQLKANSLARNMARYVSQIETVGGKSPVVVETAVQAALPESPTSPQVPLFVAVGVLGGFAAAVLLALVLSYRASASRRRAAARSAAVVWWDDRKPQAEPSSGDARGGHHGLTPPQGSAATGTSRNGHGSKPTAEAEGDQDRTEQATSTDVATPPNHPRTKRNGVASPRLRAKRL